MFGSTESPGDLRGEKQMKTWPHSRLYHLEPIGVGSAFVESLTSYIIRLADAHSVHPRTLLLKELFPVYKPSLLLHNDPRKAYLPSFWKTSTILNGTASSASNMVLVLEQLTLRKDLRFLTMLTFSQVLSFKSLMKPTQAWCPICYQEWREAGQIVYNPLLWSLACFNRCSRHQCRLCLRCFACESIQLPIASRSLPGRCDKCGTWLGKISLGDLENLVGLEEEQTDQLVGEAPGQMLAAAPYLLSTPRRDTLAKAITAHLNEESKETKAALARRLHISYTALQSWQRCERKPQLGLLLQVSTHLGVSPLHLMTGCMEGR